ncbi:hypothetical protein BJX68DRAFT_190200 [Aspergillus pseudodeflectus]|uniref:Uncharacterized protein n=1 Tax=Aspergillus pseudodeflectus TaxID=176178 RepID=A0ABR4JIZ0_9EURO
MPRPSPSAPRAEKNMSSRLLTMKFMQRAAASAAAKESSQPESASNSQASTPKKRRISTEPAESPSPTRPSDMEAISAALAEEEEKRRDAIARQAAEAGETEWFLDFDGADSTQYAQPPVLLADYSLDADDDDIGYGGRQVYGNYKKKNKPTATTTAEGDQDESEAREMIRQSRPKVNLSELNSISGGRRANPMAVNDKFQKKRKHK